MERGQTFLGKFMWLGDRTTWRANDRSNHDKGGRKVLQIHFPVI